MDTFSFSRLPANLLNTFDLELQYFYWRVLKKATENNEILEGELATILAMDSGESYRPGRKANCNLFAYRAVYLFRYSPCYTSATAKYFLKLVKNNPTVLNEAMSQCKVNICCLGGGPASEVVALCKILTAAQARFWKTAKKPLHLHITVVDKIPQWKETANYVLQTIIESKSTFHEVKVMISFRFLKADLTKPLGHDVHKAIKEADIISMVKFLSVLKQKIPTTISWLTDDIAANMKVGSILFYLDIGETQKCYAIQKSLSDLVGLECIYGPVQLECFTLTLNSLKKCMELFREKFHQNICLPSAIVSSRAWIKIENGEESQASRDTQPGGNVIPEKPRLKKVQWKKQSRLRDIELKTFHQKVHQMFPKKKKTTMQELFPPRRFTFP